MPGSSKNSQIAQLGGVSLAYARRGNNAANCLGERNVSKACMINGFFTSDDNDIRSNRRKIGRNRVREKLSKNKVKITFTRQLEPSGSFRRKHSQRRKVEYTRRSSSDNCVKRILKGIPNIEASENLSCRNKLQEKPPRKQSCLLKLKR